MTEKSKIDSSLLGSQGITSSDSKPSKPDKEVGLFKDSSPVPEDNNKVMMLKIFK